jgi:hypothetical protein
MSDDSDEATNGPPEPPPDLPPRVRRILRSVYAVEGVASARVWLWEQKVAVGVRGTNAISVPELLRRVETAIASLREPDETWDFGLLEEDA